VMNEELWQAVLAQIQLNISSANFATWFKNTQVTSQKDGVVFISVSNSFVKEWLEQKYNKIIFKILHNLDKDIKEVRYETGKSGLKILRKIPSPFLEEGQLEFKEFKIDSESSLDEIKNNGDEEIEEKMTELINELSEFFEQNDNNYQNIEVLINVLTEINIIAEDLIETASIAEKMNENLDSIVI